MNWKPMSEKEVFLVSQIAAKRLRSAGKKQGRVYSSQQILARPAYKIGLVDSIDFPSKRSTCNNESAALVWSIIRKLLGSSEFLYQLETDGPMGKCFLDENNREEMMSYLFQSPSSSFLSQDFTEGCWVSFPEKSLWVFGPKLVVFVKKANVRFI